MNDLCVDLGYRSLNKFGEQLCGDMIQVVKDNDTTILVLADGLGSGVKANILSTLTSKIISTMIAEHMSIEECVGTIMSTLPVCKVRGIAYSTFTIIRISNNTYAEIIQYDNHLVVLVRDGKKYDYPTQTKIISGKKIVESKIRLNCDDVFVAMSDGAIYAGVGQTLNYGWQRENIIEFIESHYDRSLSANAITSLLLDTCNNLYANMPGDDTTIATIKIRKRKVVNLMFGPPQNPDDVYNMMSLFFAKQGRHIVCGGTTSTLAAQFLGKKLETSIDYIDPRIPPVAKIEGVDLVTEGVLTISLVLEYAKDYIDKNALYNEWHNKNDGASRIARMLFEEATDINFYVGRAINPAHQNPKLPIGFNIKMQLVEELSNTLKQMGKTINLSYF
jgi:hypothetical protein